MERTVLPSLVAHNEQKLTKPERLENSGLPAELLIIRDPPESGLDLVLDELLDFNPVFDFDGFILLFFPLSNESLFCELLRGRDLTTGIVDNCFYNCSLDNAMNETKLPLRPDAAEMPCTLFTIL